MQGTTTATRHQVRFAIDLLEQQGYSVQHVEAAHRRFGARQVGQSVEGWLWGLSRDRISGVIDALRREEL